MLFRSNSTDLFFALQDFDDHAAAVRAHCAQDGRLQPIRILVFVDQNVFETVVVIFQHIRVFGVSEDRDHVQQEIAEIAAIQDLEPILVRGVKLDALALGERERLVLRNLLRNERAVLPPVDDPGEQPRREALLVDAVGFGSGASSNSPTTAALKTSSPVRVAGSIVISSM